MGIKTREFISYCADLVGLGSVLGAAGSGAALWYWSKVKDLPAPLSFFIGLITFTLTVGVIAFVRFNMSYRVIDLWEGKDDALPDVWWQIRVGKSWDGVGGRARRILGACTECRTGLGDADGDEINCYQCQKTLASVDFYKLVMKRVLAEKKFVWENGKAGFKKVMDSERE